MTRRTGMLPGWTGRAGIAGVCARITGSAIGMRAHTTRAVRRMSIPPEAIQAMFRAADLIPLDPGRRRLVGRGRLVATLLVIAFYTNPSPVSGQEHAVAVVGGVAATGTSAEQQTLPVARLDAATPRFFFRDGWNIRGVGDAGWQPQFTMMETRPDYREGFIVSGGFRLAHTSARVEAALVGRLGSTRVTGVTSTNGVGDWAAFFEGGVDFRWLAPVVDAYVGLRHDDRLRRAGALSNYRDPTGRALLMVSVLPVRLGRVIAGVMFESETALPGTGRLPSGVTVSALFKY